MGTLSKSSEIAIQIAEYEAVRSRHKSIEPEHVLLGIFSLEKVFDAGAQSQFQLNPDAVDSVRIEFEPLQSFLRAKGVDPPLMRRSIRELLRKYVSSKLEQAGTVPRPSAKIQDLCVRAAGVTDAMKSPEIRIEHFLSLRRDGACPPLAARSAALRGTDWRMLEIDGERPAFDDWRQRPTLRLDDHGKYTASTGCNSLVGSYELDPEGLRFLASATPLNGCAPSVGALERRFVDALGAVRQAQLAGVTLDLLDAAGKRRLRLEARGR